MDLGTWFWFQNWFQKGDLVSVWFLTNSGQNLRAIDERRLIVVLTFSFN
jgi:hypothetical protein